MRPHAPIGPPRGHAWGRSSLRALNPPKWLCRTPLPMPRLSPTDSSRQLRIGQTRIPLRTQPIARQPPQALAEPHVLALCNPNEPPLPPEAKEGEIGSRIGRRPPNLPKPVGRLPPTSETPVQDLVRGRQPPEHQAPHFVAQSIHILKRLPHAGEEAIALEPSPAMHSSQLPLELPGEHLVEPASEQAHHGTTKQTAQTREHTGRARAPRATTTAFPTPPGEHCQHCRQIQSTPRRREFGEPRRRPDQTEQHQRPPGGRGAASRASAHEVPRATA